MTESGQTYLELRSAMDPAGWTREEFMILALCGTMPESGHLRQWAKKLCAADPHYADFESRDPPLRSNNEAGPSSQVVPIVPAVSDTLTDRKRQRKQALVKDAELKRLEAISVKGKARIEQSQRGHERGYAQKRRGRNRRVEVLTVGIRCTIYLHTRSNRNTPVQAKLWEKPYYTVVAIGEHKITVRMEEDNESDRTVACSPEDVLPVYTSDSKPSLGVAASGGPCVSG